MYKMNNGVKKNGSVQCTGCDRCIGGIIACGALIICNNNIIMVQHNYGKREYNDFGGRIKKGKSISEIVSDEIKEESINTIIIEPTIIYNSQFVEYYTPSINLCHKYRSHIIHIDEYNTGKFYDAIKSPEYKNMAKEYREIINVSLFSIGELKNAYNSLDDKISGMIPYIQMDTLGKFRKISDRARIIVRNAFYYELF